MGLDIQTVLDAVVADGAGVSILVEDYGDVLMDLATASSAAGVVKFYGSNSEFPPDFAAAQSVANMYDAIQITDLENGAVIDGDTGITLAGTDDFRHFEMNTNHFRWVTAVVSSWSVGAFTVKCKVGKKMN